MLYWCISPLFSMIHVSVFCHLIDVALLISLRWLSSFCPATLLLLIPTASQLFPLSLSLSCQSPWAPSCFLNSHNSNPLVFLVCWFWMLSLTLCLSCYSVLCIYSAHFKTMPLFKYCISSKLTRGSYISSFLIPLYYAVCSLYIFHPNFFWHFSAVWVLSLCTAPMNQQPLLYPGNLRWSLANCLSAHSRERRSILFFFLLLLVSTKEKPHHAESDTKINSRFITRL